MLSLLSCRLRMVPSHGQILLHGRSMLCAYSSSVSETVLGKSFVCESET